MDCCLPTPTTDRELLAYLAGDAPPGVATHVKTCPACRERARRLRASEAWLHQTLYRAECPDAQTLSDLRQGYLNSTQRRRVDAHLARCPRCRAELTKLDRFLAAIAPFFASRVASAVRVLVARLVTWPQPDPGANGRSLTGPGLVYGAVRGPDDRPARVYHAEEFQVILDIEVDPHRPDRRRLQGFVTGEAGAVELALSEARLTGAGTTSALFAVDDLGNFAFGALAPGVYDLTLLGPGLELRVPELDLR